MTKRLTARERRIEALAKTEGRVHERLLSLRGDIDQLLADIDRVTLPRPPRPMAAARGPALALDTIVSLAAHRRRRRKPK